MNDKLAGAQEREAFEAEYHKRYAVPAHADHLTFPDAARAWEWWQARANVAAPEGSEPVATNAAIMEKIDTLIASVNEAHHAKSEGWRDGCFAAADRVYDEIKTALATPAAANPAAKE